MQAADRQQVARSRAREEIRQTPGQVGAVAEAEGGGQAPGHWVCQTFHAPQQGPAPGAWARIAAGRGALAGSVGRGRPAGGAGRGALVGRAWRAAWPEAAQLGGGDAQGQVAPCGLMQSGVLSAEVGAGRAGGGQGR